MRKLIIIVLIMHSYSLFSQTLRYSDLNTGERLKYTCNTYISEHGESYSVGDKIVIGYQSEPRGYQYIYRYSTLSSYKDIHAVEKGETCIITNVYISGYKKSGYIAYIKINNKTDVIIEKAIKSKEIESSWYNPEDAKYELQKLNDEFELELISQQEYNRRKQKLSKYLE